MSDMVRCPCHHIDWDGSSCPACHGWEACTLGPVNRTHDLVPAGFAVEYAILGLATQSETSIQAENWITRVLRLRQRHGLKV